MCSAGNVRVSLEEEFFQFALAYNSSEFLDANERDEHREDQQHQAQNSVPCTPTQPGDTLPKRLVAMEADRCIVKNLETGKHNRKER